MNTAEIIEFWFADSEKWYKKDPNFDNEIREKYLGIYEAEFKDNPQDKLDSPETALAYVILFDQFARNMFRDSARMYEADDLALAIAQKAIALGFDKKLDPSQRHFLYMPFMHSEDLQLQKQSLEHFASLENEMGYRYAKVHYDIIERFNRYPHRNEILGRESTDEECHFLENEHAGF